MPFAVGFYLSYLFRTVSAVIAGLLIAEFNLTPSGLGLLTSVYFLTFAVAQLPVGFALDRYGPRRVQSILLLVAASGAVLFAASAGFVSLLVGRGLIGLGLAGSLTAGLKASILWFPKEQIALVNGAMVMIGAFGAFTATAPAEWLLGWTGWRGLFELLAVMTAGSAVMIYLLVPEILLPASTSTNRHLAGFKIIFCDARFWRLAPAAATTIGTAWALQGLWAAPWLSDVEGLDRVAVVNRLSAMAVMLSLGALLMGAVVERLRRNGLAPQPLFGILSAMFIVIQLALILRWPVSSLVEWCAVAVVGAGTIVSYAAVAEYFPKELAGRANAALNVFHVGGAFLLQELTGIVLQHWPTQGGHYSVVAYEMAFAINVVLQATALIWFTWPYVRKITISAFSCVTR